MCGCAQVRAYATSRFLAHAHTPSHVIRARDLCPLHVVYHNVQEKCGSRTWECEHCGRLVVGRLMAAHVAESCSALHPREVSSGIVPDARIAAAPVYAANAYAGDDDAGVGVFVDAALSAGLERFNTAATTAAAAGSSTRHAAPAAGSVASNVTSTSSGVGGSRSAPGAAVNSAMHAHSAALSSSLGTALGINGRGGVSTPTVSAAALPHRTGSSSVGTAAGPLRARAPASSVTAAPVAAARAGARGGVTATSTTARPSAGESFPCPHCAARCRDYEALQMHVFTACKKYDAASGADPSIPASSADSVATAGNVTASRISPRPGASSAASGSVPRRPASITRAASGSRK